MDSRRRQKKRFINDTLSYFKISKKKIVYLKKNKYLEFENLIAPTPPCRSGNPSKSVCLFLNKKIPRKKIKCRTKILIQRNELDSRGAMNFWKLKQNLKNKNFFLFKPEKFSVSEQAFVFSKAKIIIGIHGSALTNLIFCKEKTKIIEIFSHKYVNACYLMLCNSKNLIHHSILDGEDKYKTITKIDDASQQIKISDKMINKVLELCEK